ncbi:Protein NLP1 [Acorus calamus]|uniref:Protein NLP1 n=1 Tax=Acorus calamus TaxID=4465 RepID=A0AAV9DCH8_ACOCL|nr:Protein NLP1 [Acorus calamus]
MMEDAIPSPSDALLTLSDEDFDLVDELFSEGGWFETNNDTKFLEPGVTTPASPFVSTCFSPSFDITNSSLYPCLSHNNIQINPEGIAFPSSSQLITTQKENDENLGDVNQNELEANHQQLWIQSNLDSGSSVSVKERLVQALGYIKESNRDSDVLVQLWVPIKRGDRHVLTTRGQPFSLNPGCERLVKYRTVSAGYHFSAEEGSGEALGLPGRVFMWKVPEWTPDVQYFSSFDYPRVTHAQMYNVRGTLAIPVFETGSRSCLGVVEVVTTTQMTNYRTDLENICNALQAVNLRSSEVPAISYIKENDSYQAALPEIIEVVRAACEMHRLPLAQTWIPCIQQGKLGARHSDENYKDCISTVDIACNVTDRAVWDFHKACSEHHLFKGQGVVGKAFKTNQPCFSPDITEFSKMEYPLAHHAKMFGLRAAVAIRLRSIHTGMVDYVLEFFLPTDCLGSEEQRLLLSSLSVTVQQVCQSLRVVSANELGDVEIRQQNELVSFSGSSSKDAVHLGHFGADSSWTTSTKKDDQEGKHNILPTHSSLEFKKNGKGGLGESNVTTQWEHNDVLPVGGIYSQSKNHDHDFPKNITDHGDSLVSEPTLPNLRRGKEKKRTKTEKTVSLQVLRQYFAGSLKDAAKSIGVCPTTLKRICRQHGITRWPSRKIKKVDHSLKKLQLVIDSVKGAQGAFQISSIYDSFPKAPPSDFVSNNSGGDTATPPKQNDNPGSSNIQPEGVFSTYSISSGSQSSSCSQSSSSSPCCSSGTKPCSHSTHVTFGEDTSVIHSTHVTFGEDTSVMLNHTESLKRTQSDLKLHVSDYGVPEPPIVRSQSHKSLDGSPSLGILSTSPKPTKIAQDAGSLRMKVTYGEEKIRFRMQTGWGFSNIQQEIAKRFNIGNVGLMNLKYLDDDKEWVLLTCDDDLYECIEIYKSGGTRAISLSVHCVTHPSSGSSLASNEPP